MAEPSQTFGSLLFYLLVAALAYIPFYYPSHKKAAPAGENRTLVYGSIRAPETSVHDINVSRGEVSTLINGMFYVPSLKAEKEFCVTSFAIYDLRYRLVESPLCENLKGRRFVFLGSYEAFGDSAGKVELRKLSRPSAADILELVKERKTLQGTGWPEAIELEISRLRSDTNP